MKLKARALQVVHGTRGHAVVFMMPWASGFILCPDWPCYGSASFRCSHTQHDLAQSGRARVTATWCEAACWNLCTKQDQQQRPRIRRRAPRPELLLVGCLTSQQHTSVSQGRICSDNFTCCHTEIEVADPTFHLTQSQYTDIGPTSPSADPITPGAWQGSHWSANFYVTGMTRPRKNPVASRIRTRDLPLSRGGRLTTRPTRRSAEGECSRKFLGLLSASVYAFLA